ncbi:MAG: hypothetical protein EG823_09190 [Actinobacteria bacterium]|nr:hypothetical protein [Actinomycetota bacterium]
MIGLVVLGLLGCCGIAIAGGFLFAGSAQPADTIETLNQAALDRDATTFDQYIDAESVSTAAYEQFIQYIMTTEDYTLLVDELGEAEAERVLREEVLPRDSFIEELSAEFSFAGLEEDTVPFPEYTISSTTIDNDTAEVTLTTVEDGEEVEYVLGMTKETVGEEEIWVIKEIKNIDEMLQEQLGI